MWRTIDLSLRFVYVAAVPVAFPFINVFMPITGMLIGAGLATVVSLIGVEVWHAKVDHMKYVGKGLGKLGRLGEFYNEHPCKALIFYIFYPVLLPVVLWFRVPRREFLMYRSLNASAALVIMGTGALEYFRHWRPELGFTQFLAATIVMFAAQLVITFMLVMPIATTLIAFRQRRHIRILSCLVTLMIGTGVYGAVEAHRLHGAVPIMTFIRLEERTKYAREELKACVEANPKDVRGCLVREPYVRALVEAVETARFAALLFRSDDVATAFAHASLAQYYKPDEAKVFRVVGREGVIMVYARQGNRPPIWMAIDRRSTVFHQPKYLPPILRRVLGIT